MRHGSVNFEDMLSRGAVIGTPAYASYQPHHERGAGGSWDYVNMYFPIDEVALEWIADGRDIAVDDLWVVTEGDGLTGPAYIRKDQGGVIERVIEIDCAQIEADGFDVELDEGGEWLSARVYGNTECVTRSIVSSVGEHYHFFSEEDKETFLHEVQAIYDKYEMD